MQLFPQHKCELRHRTQTPGAMWLCVILDKKSIQALLLPMRRLDGQGAGGGGVIFDKVPVVRGAKNVWNCNSDAIVTVREGNTMEFL